ncbi:MAG TPA: hypothetical protein PLX84_09160 [Acidiphilium sp.]|nr:hypothetical protein [Acidiphilium sp.]
MDIIPITHGVAAAGGAGRAASALGGCEPFHRLFYDEINGACPWSLSISAPVIHEFFAEIGSKVVFQP